MSILLLFNPGSPPIISPQEQLLVVERFGLKFYIDDVERTDRILLAQSFSFSWQLGSHPIVRATCIDVNPNKVLAYRPNTREKFEVYTTNGELLFRGRIVDITEKPLEEPNSFVGVDLEAVGLSEYLDHRHYTGSFGTDANPLVLMYPGNPTKLRTWKPHGLRTLDQVQISGVGNPTPGEAAKATKAFSGDKNNVKLETREHAESSNTYELRIVAARDGNGDILPSVPFDLRRDDRLTTVTPETDGSGAIITTANQFVTQINGHGDSVFFAELDTSEAGNDGSGVIGEDPQIKFSGGKDSEIVEDISLPVNAIHVVTVVDEYEFTIPVNTPITYFGGVVQKLVRTREIIRALESYMDDYGIYLDPNMEEGPWVQQQIFDAEPINSIHRKLSGITGWVNRTLPDGKFEFFQPGTKLADYSFTEANLLGGVSWNRNSQGYANVALVQYGGTLLIERSQAIAGDGVNRIWPLKYRPVRTKFPYASPGHIRVQGSGEYYHVGVYGWDTLFEFVYDPDYGLNGAIRQLTSYAGVPATTPPPAGWAADFFTNVQYPQIARVTNDVALASEPPIETKVSASEVWEYNAAVERARAVLDRAATMPKKGTLVTREGLIWPGAVAGADVPTRALVGTYLLGGIEFTNDEDGKLRYSYSVIEGVRAVPNFIDDLRELFGGGGGGGGFSGSSGSSGGGTGFTSPAPSTAPDVGSGTIGKIAKWVEPTKLGDSIFSETGVDATVGGNFYAQGVLFATGIIRSTLSTGWAIGSVAGVPRITMGTTGPDTYDFLAATNALANLNAANVNFNRIVGTELGIGISVPSAGKAEVKQTVNGASGGLAVTNSAGTGGIRFWVDASNNAAIYSGAAGAGVLFVNGAGGTTYADGFLGRSNYASQVSGWGINSLGAADFRYVYTDELHAKAFVADLEQALAGGQIISKSVTLLGQDFKVPAAGAATNGTTYPHLVVEDLPSAANMRVFQSGDYVRLRTFTRSDPADGRTPSLVIADAWGTVDNYVDLPNGLQQWRFTRLAAPNAGAIATDTIIATRSIVLDYGVTGNGFYEVNAVDGFNSDNSPYSQIVTWAGTPNVQTVQVRLGQLKGLTGTNEFGFIAGNYTGNTFVRFSNINAEIRGIPLKMLDGGNIVYYLDPTVPSVAMGNPRPTAYGTGTGIWYGKDAGVYKFRAGTPGGAGIFWDNTTLTVTGVINATSGTIGNFTIGAFSISSAAAELHAAGLFRIGPLSGGGATSAFYVSVVTGAPHRVWIGDVTAATVDWYVDGGGQQFTRRLFIQTSTDGPFEIDYTGANGANTAIVFYRSGALQGSISTTAGTTQFNTSSDRRVKKNVRSTIFGLDRLNRLRVVDFEMIEDTSNKTHTGLIAQDVLGVYPQVVDQLNPERLMIDYSKLTPLLIKAVQELFERVKRLERKNG